MEKPFTYEPLPPRILFGAGRLQELPSEVERLGAARVVVFSTPEQAGLAQQAADILGRLTADVFNEAALHMPADVTDDALLAVLAQEADCVVAVGGGSTIELAKAVTLRTGLPQIAVPTTYSGYEMAPRIGQVRQNISPLHRTMSILPKTVIYDPELTDTLPAGFSCASGMNAIAHGVEALYAPDANPVVRMMALEGIAVMSKALPHISRDPGNRTARHEALFAAWMCSVGPGTCSMGLHHSLCQVLSANFGVPHAEAHAVILPHVLAYNSLAAPEAMQSLAHVLNAENAVEGLWQLTQALDLPRGLKDTGLPEEDIERAAELALLDPYVNPRPLKRASVLQLLQRAWQGVPPSM